MVNTFLTFLYLKNVGKYGKTAVFPDGYGRIGGNIAWVAMAGLGSI